MARRRRRRERRGSDPRWWKTTTRAARWLVFLVLTTLLCCVVMSSDASSSRPRTMGTQSRDTTNGARSSRRERLAEEAELVARLARILVEEEREMEMEEGVESVAMPRDDDDGVDGSVPPPPPETKNPDAKFLYDFAKAFVRTARQQFPKTVAESDDYAMQARYQASRCARSADATLSLDWFFQFMDELIAKEEMENGGGGNHYNSRMYKGSHAYRPDMYATNTGTTTNEEQTAMIPVEDLFLLRARSYYYANRVQAREHRVAMAPFCGSLVGLSVSSAIWIFSFFPVVLMATAISSAFMTILAVTDAEQCSASNCVYPRKCCDLSFDGKDYETCAYHFSICPDYCGHEGDDDGKRCDTGPPSPQTFRAVSPQFVDSYERFCCDGICCPTGFVCCDKEDAVGKLGPKCEKVEMCIDSRTNATNRAPGRLQEIPKL